MENIILNPGLQHLVEKIFWNLDVEHLKICGLINKSCRQILNNPIFWLRKFRGLSKENKKDWIKDVKKVKNSEKEKAIISYLQWNLEKDTEAEPQCFSSPTVQDAFRKIIWECCNKKKLSNKEMETVKIFAPLTDNLNAPKIYGWTPISYAARNGQTEIVKILAPLTDNPNAPDVFGETPIHKAAINAHPAIVKILAPLADNPNAPNNYGETPIHQAACIGQTEIVKFLVPLTKNPNAPNIHGTTPINRAAYNGHTKIVKILAPFSKGNIKRNTGIEKNLGVV